eukprot:COSAG03_NODE_6143_length_1107_cov_42.824405_1_plen_247_part_01
MSARVPLRDEECTQCTAMLFDVCLLPRSMMCVYEYFARVASRRPASALPRRLPAGLPREVAPPVRPRPAAGDPRRPETGEPLCEALPLSLPPSARSRALTAFVRDCLDRWKSANVVPLVLLAVLPALAAVAADPGLALGSALVLAAMGVAEERWACCVVPASDFRAGEAGDVGGEGESKPPAWSQSSSSSSKIERSGPFVAKASPVPFAAAVSVAARPSCTGSASRPASAPAPDLGSPTSRATARGV